jgi:predicted metalloprotease with PDZ domain
MFPFWPVYFLLQTFGIEIVEREEGGAIVTDVAAEGPAHRAGLRNGMHILKVGHRGLLAFCRRDRSHPHLMAMALSGRLARWTCRVWSWRM